MVVWVFFPTFWSLNSEDESYFIRPVKRQGPSSAFLCVTSPNHTPYSSTKDFQQWRLTRLHHYFASQSAHHPESCLFFFTLKMTDNPLSKTAGALSKKCRGRAGIGREGHVVTTTASVLSAFPLEASSGTKWQTSLQSLFTRRLPGKIQF